MAGTPIVAPLLDEGGYVYNVRIPDLGVTGDGTTDDGPALQNLPNGRHYVVPAGSYRIGTSATLPADTVLELARGAILRPEAGVTLTIPGAFRCGAWLCIDLSLGGTVAFTTETRVDAIRPEWFRLASESSYTDAFTRCMALQATTRSVPIRLSAATYTGRFVIPSALYLSQRGGFILHGCGMRASALVSDSATEPTLHFQATASHLHVDIRDLSVHTVSNSANVPTTLNVIDLHGLRGGVDVPGNSVGYRVRGMLRNVLVTGGGGKPAAAIRIRAPYGMRMERIITESVQWGLKLEGGSNCTVEDFFLGNNSYSGIWVDEGGSHVFVRPRLEDTSRSTTGGGYPSGVYLKNAGSNTFIGYGNEGKQIDYGIVLEGTKSSRPTINNRFIGGTVTGTERTDAVDGATILIRGHCIGNRFDMVVARPDAALDPSLRAVKFETAIIEPGESFAGNTAFPRDNRITAHFGMDGGSGWPIDMGPDPASNIVDVTDDSTAERRVFGSTLAVITPDGNGRIDLNGYHQDLTITNAGATSIRAYYLPPAEHGKRLTLLAIDQTSRVRPASGSTDQIRGTSSAGKYVDVPAQASATFVCVVDGFWEIEQSRGTLTFEP